MIEEINENCKKLSKNEDDNVMKIQKTLNESIKEIKNAVDKVKSSTETNQTKILENIKKNSTLPTSMNKKLSEQAKRNNEQIMRTIEIKINDMHIAFKTNLAQIKNCYEEKLLENVHDLKMLINSSNLKLQELISSQKANELKTELFRNYTEPAQQAKPNTIESTRSGYFKHPLSVQSISNLNSNYEWENNNLSLYQNGLWSTAQRSVHTPLAETINHDNKIALSDRNLRKKDESPFMTKKVNISPYPSPKRKLPRACKQNYSKRCTRVNIKRKISTPISKATQPMKKLQKSVNLNSSFSANKINNSNTPPRKNTQRHVNTIKAETIMSSPYLTLYETTMSEEFTFI